MKESFQKEDTPRKKPGRKQKLFNKFKRQLGIYGLFLVTCPTQQNFKILKNKTIMKKLIQWPQLAGLFSIAALSVLSLGASAQSTAKTIKGELLDMNCYMAKGAHGADHKQCAQMCLQGGAPAGVLASNGQVYLLVQDHDNGTPYTEIRKHGGEQVEVTGKAVTRNGVQALVVEKAKAI